MPIYEFVCKKCSYLHEVLMKMTAAHPVTCPSCSEDTLVKKMSQTSFVLKGQGWYETDFKEKPKKKKATTSLDKKSSTQAPDNKKSTSEKKEKSSSKTSSSKS